MAMAGTYLGIALGALDEAVQHVKSRRHTHSGRTLADSPVLQHRVGQTWARLASTRALVHGAAAAADAGDPEALLGVLSSKAEVADTATQVVGEAMTLVGGLGYAAGGRMERRLRDVRAAHIMSPTTDLLRIWAGRALLEVPLLAD
jgi:alkylation response protein AidB-like acyl-CoA dehydrogenase